MHSSRLHAGTQSNTAASAEHCPRTVAERSGPSSEIMSLRVDPSLHTLPALRCAAVDELHGASVRPERRKERPARFDPAPDRPHLRPLSQCSTAGTLLKGTAPRPALQRRCTRLPCGTRCAVRSATQNAGTITRSDSLFDACSQNQTRQIRIDCCRSKQHLRSAPTTTALAAVLTHAPHDGLQSLVQSRRFEATAAAIRRNRSRWGRSELWIVSRIEVSAGSRRSRVDHLSAT